MSAKVAATSAAAAGSVGFWGPPTATIDWCEPNYQHSFYVAEFWNTLSNLLFVLLGLYGLRNSMVQGFEPRFHAQFVAVIVTGLGSAMFHGTLQLVHQQCDETPMVWAMLVWIYIVYNNEITQLRIPKSVAVGVLTLLGAAFAVVHAVYRFTTVFQLAFGTLASLCAVRLFMHYTHVKDPRARAVAMSYVRNSLISVVFWMVDYHYCQHMQKLPVNPQGHAWWHIFIGISTYHGPVFMQYVRLEQLKLKGELLDAGFGIQTIVIHDMNPQGETTKVKSV